MIYSTWLLQNELGSLGMRLLNYMYIAKYYTSIIKLRKSNLWLDDFEKKTRNL